MNGLETQAAPDVRPPRPGVTRAPAIRPPEVLSWIAVGAGVVFPAMLLRIRGGALGPTSVATIVAVTAIVGAFVYGCYRAAHDFDRLPASIRRHPQVALHACFWLCVAACSADLPGPVQGVLAGVVVVSPFLLWRCGYLLLAGQRGRVAGTRFRDHLVPIFPIWGGSNVPVGKGPDVLARHLATSHHERAQARRSGLQLLGLALLWSGAIVALRGVLFGDDNLVTRMLAGRTFDLPRVAELLDGRRTAAWWGGWASVYAQLVLDTLVIAAQGHLFVGILRVLGYAVPRNTDRPLLARTVVEFWNRFYFYFKELMVEFFFLPTFLRCFRKHPRLRLVAAVVAAAFFGNVYYHVLKHQATLATGDWRTLWHALQARVFYAALLATGLAVSMLREQRRRGRPSARRLPAFLQIAVVVTFIAIIRIWTVDAPAAGVVVRAQFLLHLTGLG